MFFTFSQNNSGGYFIVDDKAGICEYVIIEADTAVEALERLNKIGENVDGFDEWCSCCGERWSTWMDDDDGTESPQIYDEPVTERLKDFCSKSCFVHYADGRVDQVNFIDN